MPFPAAIAQLSHIIRGHQSLNAILFKRGFNDETFFGDISKGNTDQQHKPYTSIHHTIFPLHNYSSI